MVEELRRRLLALGYEFAAEGETEVKIGSETEVKISSETETPEIKIDNETEIDNETKNPETEIDNETAALDLALGRALAFARQFCNRLVWPETKTETETGTELPDAPWELREGVLDLAAAYFLQAKMALAPESLAVMPTLTSLRLGDAAWGFAGGTQKSGTDALSRAEALATGLKREAKAALGAWHSIY